MDLFTELNQLMVEYRFRPTRKLAQYFIVNPDAIEKVVEAASLSKNDRVLEIGAGTGFLSRELLKKCSLTAVELDKDLFGLLEKELPKEVKLVQGNFLELELEGFDKVVSFPPYHISSGIMYRLFELKPKLAVLVFQKEFAEKLAAEPGFAEYNALSVLTQYLFSVELLGRLGPSSFFPKPASDSAIVRMSLAQSHGKAKDESFFVLFVKSVFRFQNKNLLNAMKNSLPFLKEFAKDSDAVIKKVEKSKLATEKVNLISVAEFVDIFNTLF